jgi:adenosine deaminase
VLVEINLTSNDLILGVTGTHHPFTTYRSYGVPVALSTDDPGIERIDLTHEYVRAVESYGLSYADLKELVRNSVEFSFLPGPSLWGRQGRLCALRCRLPERGAGQGCAVTALRLVPGEQQAAQQWELKRRFQDFEADL